MSDEATTAPSGGRQSPRGRSSVCDEVWTVVVAGGSGRRFGGLKQFARLGNRVVVEWAVAAARPHSQGIVLVIPADLPARVGPPGAAIDTIRIDELARRLAVDRVVVGGATRAESVRCGLEVVPATADIILVHDAPRPFASEGLFERVVASVSEGAEAVVPAVPVVDTLRSLAGGTVDRDLVAAVQTPQGFRAGVLRAAHSAGGEATDDATLVEQSGCAVTLVDGERHNFKITEPADLELAAALVAIRDRSGDMRQAEQMPDPNEPTAARRPLTAHGGATPVLIPAIRVGNGFDIHRFDEPGATGTLVLGGVRFDGEPPLRGHSDGDAVAHACAEALLGAAGLDDLGQHFPDTDERWRGADSIELLRAVAEELTSLGWVTCNIDCSVICERPRLAERRREMEANLSDAVGAPVNVKGRRPERLGDLGAGLGLACQASALIMAIDPGEPEGHAAGGAAVDTEERS